MILLCHLAWCAVGHIWSSKTRSSDSCPSDNTNHLEAGKLKSQLWSVTSKQAGIVWSMKITLQSIQSRVEQFWNSTGITLSGKVLYVEIYLLSRPKPVIDRTITSSSKVREIKQYSFSRQNCYRPVCFDHTVTADSLRTYYDPALDLCFVPPRANKFLASTSRHLSRFYSSLSIIGSNSTGTAKNLEEKGRQIFT